MTTAEASGFRPDYTTLTFGPPLDDRPYVIVNMVSSLDGRAVIEGSERGLGSKDDKRLMRELRFHADIVLDGAETLRVSGISPRLDDPALEERRAAAGRSRLPISSTMSRSGRLPLEKPFFTAPDFEAVVYLSETADAVQRDAIAATGRLVVSLPDGDEVPAMLRHMRHELHVELLLLEGGPITNGAFLEHDAIDEIFVTLGGTLVGGAQPKTIVEQTRPPTIADVRPLEIRSVVQNPATNELYLRYSRTRG